MTKEQRFPKWAALKEKHQAQLERLEKAKLQRREAARFITTQQQIYRLSKLTKTL